VHRMEAIGLAEIVQTDPLAGMILGKIVADIDYTLVSMWTHGLFLRGSLPLR